MTLCQHLFSQQPSKLPRKVKATKHKKYKRTYPYDTSLKSFPTHALATAMRLYRSEVFSFSFWRSREDGAVTIGSR